MSNSLHSIFGCLDPEKFKEFKLVKRAQLSHNVAKFTFELPTPTFVLGLPIGQHISCRGKDGQGEEVIKPYTPTALDSDVGHFELVIKILALLQFAGFALVRNSTDMICFEILGLTHSQSLLDSSFFSGSTSRGCYDVDDKTSNSRCFFSG